MEKRETFKRRELRLATAIVCAPLWRSVDGGEQHQARSALKHVLGEAVELAA